MTVIDLEKFYQKKGRKRIHEEHKSYMNIENLLNSKNRNKFLSLTLDKRRQLNRFYYDYGMDKEFMNSFLSTLNKNNISILNKISKKELENLWKHLIKVNWLIPKKLFYLPFYLSLCENNLVNNKEIKTDYEKLFNKMCMFPDYIFKQLRNYQKKQGEIMVYIENINRKRVSSFCNVLHHVPRKAEWFVVKNMIENKDFQRLSEKQKTDILSRLNLAYHMNNNTHYMINFEFLSSFALEVSNEVLEITTNYILSEEDIDVLKQKIQAIRLVKRDIDSSSQMDTYYEKYLEFLYPNLEEKKKEKIDQIRKHRSYCKSYFPNNKKGGRIG